MFKPLVTKIYKDISNFNLIHYTKMCWQEVLVTQWSLIWLIDLFLKKIIAKWCDIYVMLPGFLVIS
jgi:hypothetical protein